MKLPDINPKIITAAVIGVSVFLLIVFIVGRLTPSPEEYPAIASTSPLDQSEGVILTLPISISFAEELSRQQQAHISISITPELEVSQKWTNNHTLELTPARSPESTTTYTVVISYKNRKIHSFSFETATKTPEEIAEGNRQQAEDDFLFAQEEKKFYETHPWYSKLPIETADYVIVYNFEKNAFRIRLTLGDGVLGAELKAAENRALQDLENIGVDLKKYDYYVVTE